MPTATFHFPRGFLWGAATAAHQVEGNNTLNNWWAWEQEAGRIKNGDRSGLACDWWGGRWREDLDRAQAGGQNAHRMSVEWSRIQPAPDRWDEAALDRYRDIVRGLTERGLTPLVTLHHYSDPQWLAEQGGWLNPQVVEKFEKFVRKVVDALREYVSLWCTFNEPNMYAIHCYLTGEFPPGGHDLGKTMAATYHTIRAHAAAYHAIHALQPQARVGISLYYRGMQPARPGSPLDRLATRAQFRLVNELFPRALSAGVMNTPLGSRRVPEAKNTQDYLGIAYYTTDQVAFSPLHAGEMFGRRYFRPQALLSANGYIAHEPEGFFQALKWGRQYNVPMIVTENGVEDPNDSLRPRYIIEHVHQLWRAVNFNWPVKGYFHWTLVDNFEWDSGWSMKFGLWELDPATQVRRKRPSADLYAEICRENGLSTEMVTKYAPEVVHKLFP